MAGDQPVPIDVRGAQSLDHRPELGHGLPGQLGDLGQVGGRPFRIDGEVAGGGASGEGEAEQRLVEGVVQLPGHPLPLLGHGESAGVLEGSRRLDGHRRVRGQHADGALVFLGELRRTNLVGQIERPDHLATTDDRDTEEGPHRRMGPGPPSPEAGMVPQVGKTQRCRVAQHGVEHPVGARQWSQLGHQLLAPRG